MLMIMKLHLFVESVFQLNIYETSSLIERSFLSNDSSTTDSNSFDHINNISVEFKRAF